MAQDDLPPCDGCADAMTVVSWGGAYQTSQQKAYTEPYAALTGTKFTWDESSNEAVAKLRAQFEAGNVTWDLVDVEGPDSQRLCDEGLAMRDRLRHGARPGHRRLDADRGLRRLADQQVLHPADRVLDHLRLPHRRGRVERRGPDPLCDVFDLQELPRQAQPREAAQEEPRVGAALRRRRQGRPLRRALDPGRRRPRARQARHHQGPDASGGRPAPRRRSSSPTRKW